MKSKNAQPSSAVLFYGNKELCDYVSIISLGEFANSLDSTIMALCQNCRKYRRR